MTNFSIYGTLLTREEAKKIRGGNYDACLTNDECPIGSRCYGGVCTGGSCPTDPADCHGQACTFVDYTGNPHDGTCKIDKWVPNFCACVVE